MGQTAETRAGALVPDGPGGISKSGTAHLSLHRPREDKETFYSLHPPRSITCISSKQRWETVKDLAL